jgi:protein TonB
MSLRCLLFSSDEGTAAPILQVLAGLGVEGEHCSDAVATVEKASHQNFQIVIIDWDKQPEAALLLTAARERKAAERPLTLAIVSDDASVPQALQAGANSILRKPLLINQVRDTLTTARDLLRSKQDSAANATHAAAAAASASSVSALPASVEPGQERTLRAGEFLHSAPPAPGGQFVTESDAHQPLEPSSVEPVDPLRDLEPMAASVAHEEPAAAPPAPPSAPRGLEWYLKTRAGGGAGTLSPAPMPASAPPAADKPELLGYDQPHAHAPSAPSSNDFARSSAPESKPSQHRVQENKPEQKHEQKREAELFAYIAGESSASEDGPRPRFGLKGAVIGALVLASCAIVAAPQAPWHPKLRALWSREQHSVHAWLNPQPATPVQPLVVHEDFARAGDEYKMPVAENIPDATTDPSQIQVVPVVDPTLKKPNSLGGNAVQPAGDASGPTPVDQTPPSGVQSPEAQPPPSTPDTAPQTSGPVTPVGAPASATSTTATPAASVPQHSDPPAVASPPVAAVPRPAPPRNPQPHSASAPGTVPSSLQSHMVSMTPEASGNKPLESAMPSIEPVSLPEFTERALLTAQPALDYPASARGQQGTVVLQVLIGRDGSVQDAKFLQGSLAFARVAIDGVKQWRFKPYIMNGRPVSVQTLLTISFKP